MNSISVHTSELPALYQQNAIYCLSCCGIASGFCSGESHGTCRTAYELIVILRSLCSGPNRYKYYNHMQKSICWWRRAVQDSADQFVNYCRVQEECYEYIRSR